MNRVAFLACYFPNVRLTAHPGGRVEVHDPQRREGLESYVRAYEQDIWCHLQNNRQQGTHQCSVITAKN